MNADQHPPPQRCWNCRAMGHSDRECNRPRREPNACFRCFKLGHTYRDYPNAPNRRLGTVAAAAPALEENEDIRENENINHMVSVNFRLIGGEMSKCLFSLLDTGSPVSFVRSGPTTNNYNEVKLLWIK